MRFRQQHPGVDLDGRDRKLDNIDVAAIIGISRSDIGVLPNARLAQGRLFRPGLDEVVIGEGALRLYPEYKIGHSIVWQHRRWQIVGVFTTGSNIQDSLFWADLRQLQSARNVGDKYDADFVRLGAPGAFAPFKAAMEKQPRLGAKVQRLSERDSDTGKELRMVLTLVDGVITLLMAVGAAFAALNVMYATVDRRSAELGVLRALGFSRLPILAAILSESLVLAGIGGALGVVAAALLLNGFETSTIATYWAVSFRFAVTPSAVATALALTIGMGFVGGLFPAIRAARLPIVVALREEQALERAMGIEPTYAAWEAAVLPLNYARAGRLLSTMWGRNGTPLVGGEAGGMDAVCISGRAAAERLDEAAYTIPK